MGVRYEKGKGAGTGGATGRVEKGVGWVREVGRRLVAMVI